MTLPNVDTSEGICAFCGQQKRLCESHVLPAFAFRWLRGRSGSGHIRNTENPNRRVQDGLKFAWLCADCEAQFSRYETAFASKLFHPWHEGKLHIRYSEWLLKFCVSVSWRVLRFARGRNKEAKYTAEQHTLLDEAEARWRAFLCDDAPHPGKFEQHLLIFDLVKETTLEDLPSNFNRFMTGAITLDIVASKTMLMTYAKMGRFTIFGIVQKGSGKWEGTKVHVKDGIIKPGKFVLPSALIGLFREKASLHDKAMDAISPTQRAKIDQHVLDNLDQFAKSDQFASIAADAQMFGEAAVIWKK